jgi:hypothetical protein
VEPRGDGGANARRDLERRSRSLYWQNTTATCCVLRADRSDRVKERGGADQVAVECKSKMKRWLDSNVQCNGVVDR